jgi:hypothetical protein
MTTAKKTGKASKRIKASLGPKDVKGQEGDRVRGGLKIADDKHDAEKAKVAQLRA